MLSFKSMACNVAYGAIGLAFAALDNAASQVAVGVFPWYLALALLAALLAVVVARRLAHPHPGPETAPTPGKG